MRFHPQAGRDLRHAVEQAEGREVFALGEVDDQGQVVAVEIHARGRSDAVPALFRRARPGQVVIHNHPSGCLDPSEADLAMASRYGEEGIGVVIVDNAVSRERWVVEPHRVRDEPIDPEEIRAFFDERLSRVIPGWEPRPGQVEMALEVAERLHGGGVLLAEAGTGTGKSLAYLVPAALWTRNNGRRIAVATFTRALQDQLVGTDLPMLKRAGLEVRFQAVKGRGNYLCRRKLEYAQAEAASASAEPLGLDSGAADGQAASASEVREARLLERLGAWGEATTDGTRSDLAFSVPAELWDKVASDARQTLAVRCPHYGRCFYYEARRRAATSQLLVLNHSLLLADLHLVQSTGGRGMLPRYDRVILDEAHHLEEAATSSATVQVTHYAVRRAITPLLPRRRRPGVLQRIEKWWTGVLSPLPQEDRTRLAKALDGAHRSLEELRREGERSFTGLARVLRLGNEPRTLPEGLPVQDPGTESSAERTAGSEGAFEEGDPGASAGDGAAWTVPALDLLDRLRASARALGAVERSFHDVEVPDEHVQPVLDVRRSRLRLAEQAASLEAILEDHPDWCRWAERERRYPRGILMRAPIEAGDVLHRVLWSTVEAAICTSATLSVRGSMALLVDRLGLERPTDPGDPMDDAVERLERIWPSPFDFRGRVLLGLPRDLPEPGRRGFEDRAADVVEQALRAAGGGAFVLCTSFALVDALADRVGANLGAALTVLRQGEASRRHLLERFREDEDSVLFGTSSFWEGVSVKGDALRMVIIPRLPFGVPTAPLTAARHRRLREQGRDPFRVYTLPRAAIRLRQGFGRLVRSQSDGGVVLVLDRRIHDRWYGRWFLAALPPATRAQGPARSVLARIGPFYQEIGLRVTPVSSYGT